MYKSKVKKRKKKRFVDYVAFMGIIMQVDIKFRTVMYTYQIKKQSD